MSSSALMEWCCKRRSTTTPFLVVVCVLVTQAMLTTAADFYLEATLANGQLAVSKRDNATSGSAVRLKGRDSLRITFCLRQQTSVQVTDFDDPVAGFRFLAMFMYKLVL